MKKFLLFFLIFPMFVLCQDKRDLLTGDFFIIDSILRKQLPPNDTVIYKWIYSYYSDGKIKTIEEFVPHGDYSKKIFRYYFEYNQDGNISKLEKLKGINDTSWIPFSQRLEIWYDQDQISESLISYWNGDNWNPHKKSFSSDIGESDMFTTFYLKRNGQNSWDTLYKTLSKLNNANLIDSIFEKHFSIAEEEWIIHHLTTINYNANRDTLDNIRYESSNNGESFYKDWRIEFEYNSNGQIENRWERWPRSGVWWYFYQQNWRYDEYGRLWRKYGYSYTPVHPEVQSWIVYDHFYNELGLLDYRKVYCGHEHCKSDFLYYSDFYVDIKKEKLKKTTNYPNPFSTTTTIEYELNHPETVIITFYNQFGKQVDVIEQQQLAGLQQVVWTPELPVGIYYFRLKAGKQLATGKLVFMK